MSEKSNSELNEIVSGNTHVEEAKEAAQHVLESRGVINTDFEDSKGTKKKAKKKLDEKSIRRKSFYENKLFYYGLGLLLIPLYFFAPILLTSKSDLIKISGKIESCSVIYEKVYSTDRYGFKSESIRASLNFDLYDNHKHFVFRENIGQSKYLSEYDKLRNKLEQSRHVAVWIKESEMTKWNPKIYQLDVDEKTEVSLESVKGKYHFVLLFSLIMGSTVMGLILRKRWMKKEKLIQI